ncbi:MAG: transcriptional repressor [Nitrospirae bacterium]|nr:transcriptional repressor [Nitrospirota bacterium]
MKISGARTSKEIKLINEKKEKLKSFLREKGLKSTRQRDVIASEFLKTGEHVTAEELYREISKKYNDIGFTTVYRTLKLLNKSGLATERVFADHLTRYEPLSADDHHDHLICMKCGSITEFEDLKIERLQERVAEEFSFLSVSHKMEIYGYCNKCKDNA